MNASTLQREHSALKKLKNLNFLFFIFLFLDTDFASGSGFRIWIRMAQLNSHPRYCSYRILFCLAEQEIELYQFPDIDSDEEEDFKVSGYIIFTVFRIRMLPLRMLQIRILTVLENRMRIYTERPPHAPLLTHPPPPTPLNTVQ